MRKDQLGYPTSCNKKARDKEAKMRKVSHEVKEMDVDM